MDEKKSNNSTLWLLGGAFILWYLFFRDRTAAPPVVVDDTPPVVPDIPAYGALTQPEKLEALLQVSADKGLGYSAATLGRLTDVELNDLFSYTFDYKLNQKAGKLIPDALVQRVNLIKYKYGIQLLS